MSRIPCLLMAWQAVAAQPAAPHRTASPNIELRRGLVITSSVRVVRRAYSLPAHPSLDSAIIVIRGNDITVDFNGAELRGTARSAFPDEAAGVAIRIEGGRNVRVLNARVHGYRVGRLAHGTRRLDLVDNDLSYNWKPRLFSVVEHESLVDCGNRVEQSLNGIMLVRTDSRRIHDNTLSFNPADDQRRRDSRLGRWLPRDRQLDAPRIGSGPRIDLCGPTRPARGLCPGRRVVGATRRTGSGRPAVGGVGWSALEQGKLITGGLYSAYQFMPRRLISVEILTETLLRQYSPPAQTEILQSVDPG